MDNDIIVLKYFRDLVKVQNLSLQNAAAIVSTKYKDVSRTSFEHTNSTNNTNELQRSLEFEKNVMEELAQVKELNRHLLTRLDEQQKYIEERLSKRDSALLESIREIQRANTLLLEQKQEEKPKRRGIFSFFSKE